MIYFTTDLHINHDREFIFKPFDLENINQYNLAVTDAIKKTVGVTDTLWIIGDVSWSNSIDYLNLLSQSIGEIKIVLGNHDGDLYNRRHQLNKNIHVYNGPVNTKIEGYQITLSHFPMLSWEKSHYNAWQIYGHIHGKDTPVKGKMFDVIPKFDHIHPYSFDEIKEIMKTKPDNWDYIKK